MAEKNLHELPRIEDSLSFIYVERCRIEQDLHAIAAWDQIGITHIPIAGLNALLLGPGTVITQAAIAAIADNGCNIVWVGEHGVRTYACATGETHSARNVIRQAKLSSSEKSRLRVVTRMYLHRFPESLPDNLTLRQIRGREGARVRDAYAAAARQHKIEWTGRNYDRNNWDNSDPINKALSAANACLYGLCHGVIVALGYSPALGFIHSGKQLSFVYDIADLYKTDISVPIAFRAVAEDKEQRLNPPKPKERLDLETRTRYLMRDAFRTSKLLQRIPRDIAHVLDVEIEEREDDPWIDDPANPAPYWEPRAGAANVLLAADSAPLPLKSKDTPAPDKSNTEERPT